MIFLDASTESLQPLERFGLQVLLDHSRLLQVGDPAAPVLRLGVTEAAALAGANPVGALDEPIRTDGGAIRLSRTQLLAAGALAGAVVEQGSEAVDRHGRVPSDANPLVRAGASDRAPVSELAARLRVAVAERARAEGRPCFLAAPWPEGKRWAACLTSDLDLVGGWPLATALRVSEMVRHGAPGSAVRAVLAATGSLIRDPVGEAVTHLLAVLARHRFRGTWFVIAGSPTAGTWIKGDITYSPESAAVRALLDRVAAEGHEIGLHGSFRTMLDGGRLAAERERLQTLVARPVSGVRQHFLRMRPGATQEVMRGAGFDYDATFGFADRSGFRLGVSDTVPAWSATTSRSTGLEEVPLCWMDRTLSKYGGIEDPERWVDDGLLRAEACRGSEGLWVGLWHPNVATPLGFPGAESALERLVATLAGLSPWVAPLAEIVAWRRRRRAVRAASCAADGTVVLAEDLGVPIEDGAGRPVPVTLHAGRSC